MTSTPEKPDAPELTREQVEALLISELERARADYANIAAAKSYSIKNWKRRFVATPRALQGIPEAPPRYWRYNDATGRSELVPLEAQFQLKVWTPAEWKAKGRA